MRTVNTTASRRSWNTLFAEWSTMSLPSVSERSPACCAGSGRRNSRSTNAAPCAIAIATAACAGISAANSMPAAAGPAACCSAGRIAPSSPFAASSCSGGRMRGRIALYAGKKKPAPAPRTKATTASCGMPTGPNAPTTTTDVIARRSTKVDHPHDQPSRHAVGDDASGDRAQQQSGGVGRGDEREVDRSAAVAITA